MLTVLIIRGATLSGAIEGVKFYIGTVNFSVLKNPSVGRRLSAFENEPQPHGGCLGVEGGVHSSFLRPELLQWRFDRHGVF